MNLGDAHTSGQINYPVSVNLDVHTNSPMKNIEFPFELKDKTKIVFQKIDSKHRILKLNLEPEKMKADLVFKITKEKCPLYSAILERNPDSSSEVLRLSVRKNGLEVKLQCHFLV